MNYNQLFLQFALIRVGGDENFKKLVFTNIKIGDVFKPSLVLFKLAYTILSL